MATTLQEIDSERKSEYEDIKKYHSKRQDRMNKDMDRYLLEAFTWNNSAGEAITGAENVTMNDARTYADKVISVLGTAVRHIDVECLDTQAGDEEKDLGQIAEDFVKYLLECAEENLSIKGEYPYEDAQNFYGAVRGIEAAKVLLMNDGKLWYPDITSIDPFQLSYRMDRRGTAVGIVSATMTKEEILRQFEVEIDESVANVDDVWTHTQNTVIMQGTKILRDIPHNLPYNPILISPCPTTPLIAGIDDAITYQNESIYAAVRDLYDALNKQATMWASSNAMGIFPPMQFISKDGRKSKSPPYGIRAVMNLRQGEEYKAMPIRDVGVSHQAFFGQIMVRIQRATMSNIDYGELSQELSALAIKRLESKNDQIITPRIFAKRNLTKRILQAFIDQYVAGGYKTLTPFEVGIGVPLTEWKPADFTNKRFVIGVRYVGQNAEDLVSNMTIAQNALAVGLDERYVYKNILEVENPDDMIRQRRRDDAHKEILKIRRYDEALAYISGKDGKDPNNILRATWALAEIGYQINPDTLEVTPIAAPVTGNDTNELPPVSKTQPQGSLPNMEKAGGNMALASAPQQAAQEVMNRKNAQDKRVQQEEANSSPF